MVNGGAAAFGRISRRFSMRTRLFVLFGAVALVMVLPLWAMLLVAQAPSGTKSFDATAVDPQESIKAAIAAAKAEAASKFTTSKTPWGDPDLRGYYLVATYTPLQRPEALKDKAVYTEDEAIEAFKRAVENDAEVDPRNVHYDWKEYGMDAWQSGVRPNMRTSLIVEPSTGRLPPLTPEAEKRRADRAAVAKALSPEVNVRTVGSFYTRCIMGNAGGGPLVRGGNPEATVGSAGGVTAEFQIVQSPGHVAIMTESNSDVRIIPVDGRPHLPSRIRTWLGDSRGRWEGDTLVVETTNFNSKAPNTNYLGSTENLKLVERFTLIGPKSLRYQYTVSDPQTWTSSWSVDSVVPRIEPPLYEFACHEQNYGVMNVVRGAQVREAQAGRPGPRPAAGGGGEDR
jgi:hypothetical protein